MKRPSCVLLMLFIIISIAVGMDEEECELHAPNTMHEFCCDIHDENIEFLDCEIKWHDKLHAENDDDEMDRNFCISECVYNATEYLGADRKSLRMNVIKSHLTQLHADDAAEKLMYDTFKMCDQHARSLLDHSEVLKLTKRLDAHNCHPYPGLVFECVSNELILNCPPARYHSSAGCDHAKEYLSACLKHKKIG